MTYFTKPVILEEFEGQNHTECDEVEDKKNVPPVNVVEFIRPLALVNRNWREVVRRNFHNPNWFVVNINCKPLVRDGSGLDWSIGEVSMFFEIEGRWA